MPALNDLHQNTPSAFDLPGTNERALNQMDTGCNTVSLDWRTIATIGIPTIAAIIGWFLTHYLNSRRDLKTRKREARLKALETAYIRIASNSNRPLVDKSMDDIELFVSELQLYGTPRQINLMTIIVEEFKKPNSFVKYDDILKDLRDEIRKELDLEQVNGPVWWLRFDRRAAKGEDDVPTRSNTPDIRNLGQTERNSDLPAT